jgi:hypothetical protein
MAQTSEVSMAPTGTAKALLVLQGQGIVRGTRI